METSEEASVLELAPPGSALVVAHARPRCEKKIAAWCVSEGLPHYLPLRRKTHRYGGRVRTYLSPLFPGYLFCMVNAEHRGHLRRHRHVANVLETVEQERLVQQLQQVRQVLAAEPAGDPEVLPYLQPGRPVRVMAGPFQGLEGVVAQVRGRTRVVLHVDLISRSVAVEADPSFLEPAE